MCRWVQYLIRYLRFWRNTPIYYARLFTDTKDAFLLFSGFLLMLYGYIFFIESESIFAKFLLVFLFFVDIIFLILLRNWVKTKGRILFPKMTRLHGHEAQRFGFGWEEPDDENFVLPPVRAGPDMRLLQPGNRLPGIQMQGIQRPPNQPPFVPPALESRHIQHMYRRSRPTDRPHLQHESLFPRTSTEKATRDTPRRLQSSLSQQESFHQSSKISGPPRRSLADTSKANMPQSQLAGARTVRVEVHAPTEHSSQLIFSPDDPVNIGASTSRGTREDYVSATRFQTIGMDASYLENDESDDSSLELPKYRSSYKTSEKDGENASDESSLGKSGSNVSLEQSDGSPSESSIGHESDSRSDRSYSSGKLLAVPLPSVEPDAAGKLFEIPDPSEKSPKKQSRSPLCRSSLEMHERFQLEKAAKDASVSETSFSEISKLEHFGTTQTSKFKLRSSKERNILHSSKKSSHLFSASEQPVLHRTSERTGTAKRICRVSEKPEEIARSPEKPETIGMDEKAEEISSPPEKEIEISRTHKPTDISRSPEKSKITPCTPERTKRTTTPVKRKKEASSEDEDVTLSKADKVRKQKCKQPQKIPKIEEALESDDSG